MWIEVDIVNDMFTVPECRCHFAWQGIEQLLTMGDYTHFGGYLFKKGGRWEPQLQGVNDQGTMTHVMQDWEYPLTPIKLRFWKP